MQITYPYTIENGGGERLTFVRLATDEQGDYLEVENLVQPNAGPPMHVHYKQSESLTVVKGKIGVEVLGEEPKYYGEGDTVTFEAGIAHRFWNAGDEPLICKGWVRPAHNIIYFLSKIYESTKANGGHRPANFDAAYLLEKYKTEFDMIGIPNFVRKAIFPLTIFVGKMQGKHRKYADAPAAF